MIIILLEFSRVQLKKNSLIALQLQPVTSADLVELCYTGWFDWISTDEICQNYYETGCAESVLHTARNQKWLFQLKVFWLLNATF